MTRIRYKKTENQLVSIKPILCNNRFANIVIDTKDMFYKIVDANTSEVISEGISSTIHGLKRGAKSAALSFGANFNSEVRKTGTEERRLVV